MSYREERRQDQAAAAEQRRQDMLVTAQIKQAGRDAAAAQNRLDAAQRKADAAKRRADAAAFVRTHLIHLILAPVIVVPILLAWTGMAKFGAQVFGIEFGWGLPVFSEGAMWGFAAAATIARRRDPDASVWHFQTGIVVFAIVAAGLNFIHGLQAPGLDLGTQIMYGLVMAVVSVGGVIVHQLITASTRRTRAEKAEAAVARLAEARLQRAREAVVRDAAVAVDATGSAVLVVRPGMVTLKGGWIRPTRAVPTAVPGLPVPVPGQGTSGSTGSGLPPLSDDLAAEAVAFLSSPEAERYRPAPDPADERAARFGEAARDPRFPELLNKARSAIKRGDLPPKPGRRALQGVLEVRAELASSVAKALKDEMQDQDNDGSQR